MENAINSSWQVECKQWLANAFWQGCLDFMSWTNIYPRLRSQKSTILPLLLVKGPLFGLFFRKLTLRLHNTSSPGSYCWLLLLFLWARGCSEGRAQPLELSGIAFPTLLCEKMISYHGCGVEGSGKGPHWIHAPSEERLCRHWGSKARILPRAQLPKFCPFFS